MLKKYSPVKPGNDICFIWIASPTARDDSYITERDIR